MRSRISYTGDSSFISIDAAREFLKRYPENNYLAFNCGRWAVIHETTGDWLGWCGIKYSPDLNEYDIGYRFYRKYWGNGYATEAAKACLDYGFEKLGISKIVGRIRKENKASIVVLEKIGMQFEEEFLFDGVFPAVLYSIQR